MSVPAKKQSSAVVQQREPVEPALAMLQTVERLSTNPDVNPVIVEMLLKEMRDLRAQQAKANFDNALAAMQGELPVIERRGLIEVRAKDAKGERTGAIQQSTKYALYEDIIEKVLPIMAKYGFSITHNTDTETKIVVESILSGHGFERHTKLTLMHDSTGSKNSVQAVVSSVSYAKRINLCALISVATRGDDDDGSGVDDPSRPPGAINEEQVAALASLIFNSGADTTKFCDHFKIKTMPDLPAARFGEAETMLKKFATQQAKKKEANK